MVNRRKNKNIPEAITGGEDMTLTPLAELRAAGQLDARQAIKHAEVQAHYLLHAGEHHARMVKRVATLKQQLDRHIAQTTDLIRAAAEGAGSKITDTAVKAKVNLDPHVIALQDKMITLEFKELRLKYLVEAMRHRKDSIFGLRLMRQDEMKSYGSN